MKTKFTKKSRRILSAALCLLMMITALPMSAFAWTSEEGKSCTSSFGDYYVGSDGDIVLEFRKTAQSLWKTFKAERGKLPEAYKDDAEEAEAETPQNEEIQKSK